MPETLVETPPSEPTRMDQLGSMSLIQHLEELRKRVVWSIIFVAAGFAICFNYHVQIFGYMQRPIIQALHKYKMDEALVYTNPVEPFNLYIKIGLIAGIFLASPFVLYQVWLFISPGLYRHEKRYVIPFMASTVGLFLGGGYFGYRMVYPAALDFLIGYGVQFKAMITIHEYTDLFMTIVLGLGAVFEMPILIFFLALMGIVSARFLWKNFRYAILAIFVLAAIISPTPDIVNMCIFAAPMVLLYVISIGIAWMVHPKRRKARALET